MPKHPINNQKSQQQGNVSQSSYDKMSQQLAQLQYQQVTYSLEAEITEREIAIEQINQDMQDLNHCFHDLAGLIQEQDQELKTVDDLMKKSAKNTDNGLEQLKKAERHQRRGCNVM